MTATGAVPERVLVAGVGNVFMRDDGFGPEVVRRLREDTVPAGVEVGDFGVGALHLAFELLDGYDRTILIDTLHRGGEPGTLYLFEPDPVERSHPAEHGGPGAGGTFDAHSLDPAAMLGLVRTLGGSPGRLLVIGCEPAELREEMGLSDPVAAAVDGAVDMVRRLLEDAASAGAEAETEKGGPR